MPDIPVTDPDGLAVLHVLSRDAVEPGDLFNGVQGIRNMAGANIVAALESRKAEVVGKIDAQNAKIGTTHNLLRGLVGIFGAAVLGLLMAIFVLLARPNPPTAPATSPSVANESSEAPPGPVPEEGDAEGVSSGAAAP